MPLSPADRERIERFRAGFEARRSADRRFGAAVRDDRTDESYLASRFAVGERVWLELAVRPFIPHLRLGIVTDDRWMSEELEQVIEDSGDTMSEFVELGFEEAGLDWPNPTVEHYRDQGKFFYFATALDLDSLTQLDDPKVQDRAARMFEGYFQAFRPALEKQASSKSVST